MEGRYIKNNLMKDMPEDYLRKLVKDRLKEKREAVDKAKKLFKELHLTKMKVWELQDAISESKEILGRKKAITCPAFSKMKRDARFGSAYAPDYAHCKAKRFKTRYMCDKKIFKLHCFFCKLTPEQAKTASMYDRILLGRREDEIL